MRALRERDRSFLERWIADAAATRAKLDEQAYRTDARQLHRIRVRVPDKPGVLARITQTLGAAGVNIEDFELRHVSPEYGGVLVVLVAGSENLELARTLLRREGYSAARAETKTPACRETGGVAGPSSSRRRGRSPDRSSSAAAASLSRRHAEPRAARRERGPVGDRCTPDVARLRVDDEEVERVTHERTWNLPFARLAMPSFAAATP